MKHRYTVFSAHQQPATVEVTLADGAKVNATVPVLEVQLVPSDAHPGAGTTKLTFKGAEIDEATGLFVPGSTVTATYTAGEA